MNHKLESRRRIVSAFLMTLMLVQSLPLQTLADTAGASDPQQYPGAPLPVDLRTGGLVLAAEDLKVGIDQLPLTVSRVYRSDMTQPKPGVFGYKWHSLVDMEIILSGADLKLLDESGRLREYGKREDGSWVSKKYDYETIRKDADGKFVRQLKNGVSYLFGANNRIAEIRDLNGRFLMITDQGVGTNRIIRIEDRYGRKIVMVCNAGGLVIRIMDTANRICLYGYDNQGNLTTFQNRGGGQVAMNYDQDHRLTGLVGGASKYTVQYKGNRIAQQKTTLGAIASYDYAEADGSFAVHVKNAAGAVSRLEFAKDGKVTATDPTGVKETIWMNERELPVKAVTADGGTAVIEYDAHANVISMDANGAISRFTYGSDDTLKAVKAATGESVTLTYDRHRNVTSAENQRGAVTTMEWNDKGQLVAGKSPTGQSIALSYDSNGQVREMVAGDGQKTELNFTLQGVLCGVKTPTGVQINYRYDPLDRLVGVENSEGQKVALLRDAIGQVVKVVDPAGNETTMEYDPSGLVTAARDPIGAVTRLAYDNTGNLKSLADAKDNVTQWTRDPAGRVLSEIDALGKPKVAKYNEKGQLLEQVNRRGQKTALSYSERGQVITMDPNGDPASFTYDSVGRMVSMKDADSDYRFEFTPDGMTKTVTDGVTGVPVSYEYDAAGRRVTMKTGNDEVRYAYDQHGRLSVIKSSLGEVTFEYDHFGRRNAMLYPNGVKTTYAYDKLNRLTELRAVSKDGKDVNQYRYIYDIMGNRTSMIEGADKVTQYEYDSLSHLAKVIEGANITEYAYDEVGNRVSVTVNGVKEEYATGKDNQLAKAGKATFEYDADGNMVSRTTADGKRYEYRYDAANRMAEAMGPDGTATYGYAPNGARVSRSATGQKETRFLFDQEDMIAELTGNTKVAAYLHGSGIDEPLAQRCGEATAFYQADGLGSITALTDTKGASTGRYTYDAFGQTKQDESAMANPYRYTGREWDGTAGSYFYRARFYLPEVGRFTALDPLGLTQGPNQYAYCANNPINLTDPSGLLIIFGQDESYSKQDRVVDSAKLFGAAGKEYVKGFNPGTIDNFWGFSAFGVKAMSMLKNIGEISRVTGVVSAMGDTVGWGNIRAGYVNAGDNLTWLFHEATVDDWLNIGVGVATTTAAVGINALVNIVPGVAQINTAWKMTHGANIIEVSPGDVENLINTGVDAVWDGGSWIGTSIRNGIIGPPAGAVPHSSGIANSTPAYFGSPGMQSTLPGSGGSGASGGWGDPLPVSASTSQSGKSSSAPNDALPSRTASPPSSEQPIQWCPVDNNSEEHDAGVGAGANGKPYDRTYKEWSK